MKNKNIKKLAIILPAIVFSVILGTVFGSSLSSIKAEATSNPVGYTSHSSVGLPLSFSTSVNGDEKAEVVTTINRGETTQLDVLATPMINGISGDMEVTSSLPQCGTVNISLGCTPQGITVSLPTSTRVSSSTHVPLIVSVSKDVPPGTYWYSIATTPVKDPSKNLPVSMGYVEAFGIQVL